MRAGPTRSNKSNYPASASFCPLRRALSGLSKWGEVTLLFTRACNDHPRAHKTRQTTCFAGTQKADNDPSPEPDATQSTGRASWRHSPNKAPPKKYRGPVGFPKPGQMKKIPAQAVNHTPWKPQIRQKDPLLEKYYYENKGIFPDRRKPVDPHPENVRNTGTH